MEARFNASSNAHIVGGQRKNKQNHQQFPASTFPETFKDFFSMINEDEDHIELVSNLEDKVIPRYNVRGRNRSSSAKFSNTTSLLPTTPSQVRSSSFRVNRNTGQVAGNVTPSFCQHIKYCCLHQSLNNSTVIATTKRLDSEKVDRTNRFEDYGESRSAKNVAKHFKIDAMNSNSGGSSGFSNFSDDEKSMKLTRKFSVDASINFNLNPSTINNKSLQHSYESFDTRKCNCESCSAMDFNNCTADPEFTSKLKATNSSYCLMRHNRSVNQLRSSERSSSGVSNVTFNYSSNSGSSSVPDKTTEATTLSSTSNSRKQMELNRQKSPTLNRRRASSITLARTVPNFGPPSQTSPVHNPNDLYRYMKGDEHHQQQQYGNRLENRDMYSTSSASIARSKSPNIFNRKALDSNTSAVNKSIAGGGIQKQQQQQQQRARTASMPGENRKPRLADCSRRSAIHCADADIEYYRLRSFSITSHGICNLGDSMRSRRSRSINSVTSSNSGRDRKNSTSSQQIEEVAKAKGENEKNVAYKVAMLGDSAVGKSSLTYQFTTSEYICAYDLSLDDDYGQKTVSVLLNNQETDLEVIDHPACEMSVEAFCSTYSIDLFVIVYSIVDRKTFKSAERILLYLKENEMMLTRGVILVGNKTDLERQREVSTQAGRKLAKEIGCKFIETSSGLNHKVDELLVGIVAQVKLNPQRIRNLSEKQRTSLCMTMHQKMKGTSEQDHFSQLRRNERNKSNNAKGSGTSISKKHDPEDESDDERSSDDESSSSEQSDIEKYFNVDASASGEGLKITRLLKSRRHATPGMVAQGNYGIINSYFKDDRKNSNNNVSSSSCSTPTTPYPPVASSSSTYVQTKTNKRDPKLSYENKNNPSSSSQPATPKKSNLSATEESDTGAEKCINKISNRTKLFLTSFLKFKRSLRVKRNNSNSCSDLFVI